MGFLGKNEICGCCGESCKTRGYKVKKSNSWICADCLKSLGATASADLSQLTIEEVKNMKKYGHTFSKQENNDNILKIVAGVVILASVCILITTVLKNPDLFKMDESKKTVSTTQGTGAQVLESQIFELPILEGEEIEEEIETDQKAAYEMFYDTYGSTTEEIISEYKGDNELLKKNVFVQEYYGDSGTTLEGYVARIFVDKEAFGDTITGEDLMEFAETSVRYSDYEYFTIVFDDGTGIGFDEANTYLMPYGELADYYIVSSPECYIIQTTDGTSYQKSK